MLGIQAEHSFGAHFARCRNKHYSGPRHTRSNRQSRPILVLGAFAIIPGVSIGVAIGNFAAAGEPVPRKAKKTTG